MDEFPAQFAAELTNMQIDRCINAAKGLPNNIALFWKKDLPAIAQSYLLATFEKLYYTRTILSRNEQIPLKTIYVPSSFLFRGEAVTDMTLQNLFERSNRILIRGNGGLGKSTCLRNMFFEAMESKEYFPIYVNLRDLNDEKKTLTEFVRSSLERPYGKAIPEKAFQHLLNQKAILMLDAFDELNDALLAEVVREVNTYPDIYPNLKIIATSRPLPAKLNEAFSEIEICPLTKPKAIAIALKLPIIAENKKAFIAALNESLYEEFEVFASSPLLLSLMALVYNSKRTIPDDISLYYNYAINVLVSEHDAHKPDGGHERVYQSGLSPDQIEKPFSAFSCICMMKGTWSLTRQLAIEQLEFACKMSGMLINANSLLDDLHRHACLLVQEGLEYSFLHRTFAEHFAAKHVARLGDKNLQRKLLERFSGIVLYPGVFERTAYAENTEAYIRYVIIPIIEDFLKDLKIQSFDEIPDEDLFYSLADSDVSLRGKDDTLTYSISASSTLSTLFNICNLVFGKSIRVDDRSESEKALLTDYIKNNANESLSIDYVDLPDELKALVREDPWNGLGALKECKKLHQHINEVLQNVEASSKYFADLSGNT